MSIIKVTKTTYGLGSSDTVAIGTLFEDGLRGYDPVEIMNSSVISGRTKGNPDFPEGVDMDYGAGTSDGPPTIVHFVPNVESPGVGNFVPKTSVESSDDLTNKPSLLSDMEKLATGDNGSITSPSATVAKIASQKVTDPSA
jgi:hypothetical protein